MTKVLLDCPLCEIALLVLHSQWCPDNDPNLGVFSSQCPDSKFSPFDSAIIHACE